MFYQKLLNFILILSFSFCAFACANKGRIHVQSNLPKSENVQLVKFTKEQACKEGQYIACPNVPFLVEITQTDIGYNLRYINQRSIIKTKLGIIYKGYVEIKVDFNKKIYFSKKYFTGDILKRVTPEEYLPYYIVIDKAKHALKIKYPEFSPTKFSKISLFQLNINTRVLELNFNECASWPDPKCGEWTCVYTVYISVENQEIVKVDKFIVDGIGKKRKKCLS